MSIANVKFKTLPDAEDYWNKIIEDKREEWTIVKSIQN